MLFCSCIYFYIYLTCAHQQDAEVTDRQAVQARTLHWADLQTTFSGPWDQASHWFLREKPHYGLSFISAVLGQFKPTLRTCFGGITEVMIDGKVWMSSSTVRGNTKTSVDHRKHQHVFTSPFNGIKDSNIHELGDVFSGKGHIYHHGSNHSKVVMDFTGSSSDQ